MSLLLDARKKSQGGSDSHPELALGLEEPDSPAAPKSDTEPLKSARSAGQNLFNAKSAAPRTALGGVNRNLVFALLGSIVLFGAGAAYVWYAISANDRPVVQIAQRTVAIIAPPPAIVEPAASVTAKPDNLVAAIAAAPSATGSKLSGEPATRVTKKAAHPAQPRLSINVAQNKTDTLDTLLSNAYQAYRAGKFEQAHRLYRDALAQEPSNTDALLGLAAIAQHLGADTLAVQYYRKVLALDPRNAVANAGMSALGSDENRESHLKMLLNGQRDSSSLHFALGNHYAEQARWGEAQQAYFNAYKLDPNNASLAFNLAISLERLGQKKLSSQYYQRAVQLDMGSSAGFDHAAIEQHAQQLAQ
jgi:tetratricopeptide (TPR) repeat protein